MGKRNGRMKAVGVHVFAGGFTMGVRKVFDVTAQMEVHGLGQDTVEQRLGLPFIMPWPKGSKDADLNVVDQWLERRDLYEDCSFCYGNPRCTGFSVLNTSKGAEGGRGPWARQNIDIRQLCDFGIRAGIPVICWESVQQAFTTGRPLLDYLRDEVFVPRGYRIAHLLLNAATFGNAQHRKRYFFVAYRDDLNFDVDLPALPDEHTTVRDVIGGEEWLSRETRHARLHSVTCKTYDADTWARHPHEDEHELIPELLPGWTLNDLHTKRPEVFRAPGRTRLLIVHLAALGDMPFGMHNLARIEWDKASPVITGGSGMLVHPELHRTLTVRELSALMGWPADLTPIGPVPACQIGKGVVPAVGEWLARQVQAVLEGRRSHDKERSLIQINKDGSLTSVEGRAVEKVIDMTYHAPQRPRAPKPVAAAV